jgi:hypothetical protein
LIRGSTASCQKFCSHALVRSYWRSLVNPDSRPGIRLDPFPEIGVLGAGARQDGDEASLLAVDVIHGLRDAKLGIGHIEEVRPPGDLPQGFPGLDMRAHVAGVSVPASELDGDPAVGSSRQHKEQLLKIGPVILR